MRTNLNAWRTHRRGVRHKHVYTRVDPGRTKKHTCRTVVGRPIIYFFKSDILYVLYQTAYKYVRLKVRAMLSQQAMQRGDGCGSNPLLSVGLAGEVSNLATLAMRPHRLHEFATT